MDGTCNCGAVHVRVSDDELFSKRRGHICHCTNCQKTASSSFATNLIIETSKVTITGDENLTLYEDGNSRSGRTVKRYFCRRCGNPIKSETEPASQAGKVILKTGIFDKVPKPELETFLDTKQEWVRPADGTTKFRLAVGGEKYEEQ
ncbi:MAG: hypothetical protein M1828_000808 [Chrysothrix sp. TS-e1954]|nr:MAG: hypothetical protein M1828_000808 [Chrysothrix sp. TS-e1954]